jgi:Na+-driven multidrug efflux pump
MAATFIYSNALRGAGDTVSPMIVNLISAIAVRVPIVYLFAYTFGWGLQGVYWGTLVDWAFRASLYYGLFQRGRWRRVEV